jgi:hypothetical protein
MQHVDQWYRYLSEAEKTATMYTLLQHSTQVQTRFFINLLQQMIKRDPLHSLLTPSNPDQGTLKKQKQDKLNDCIKIWDTIWLGLWPKLNSRQVND